MRAKCAAIAAMAMMITAGFSQGRVKALVLNASTSDAKATSAASNLVGVWHGEYRGLPWVTVTLTDEGGTLSGAVLFIFIARQQVLRKRQRRAYRNRCWTRTSMAQRSASG
jgi:hypothetical protein